MAAIANSLVSVRDSRFQALSVLLQISKALTETDKKDLMRRLPKFIYDEEKALEVSLDDYGINISKRSNNNKVAKSSDGDDDKMSAA
ncbi:hypothetical protein BHE74_00017063 [Ensete ventricosum]|nr:hypothetical protein BHE74_00017063 [Ensete ventricosum]